MHAGQVSRKCCTCSAYIPWCLHIQEWILHDPIRVGLAKVIWEFPFSIPMFVSTEKSPDTAKSLVFFPFPSRLTPARPQYVQLVASQKPSNLCYDVGEFSILKVIQESKMAAWKIDRFEEEVLFLLKILLILLDLFDVQSSLVIRGRV